MRAINGRVQVSNRVLIGIYLNALLWYLGRD